MPSMGQRSINADTMRLFTPAEESAGVDLRQSVEDRILTLRGQRRHRPHYGSLATRFDTGGGDLETSIRDALAGDARIRAVSFRRGLATLTVIIDADPLRITAEVAGA